MPAHKIAFSPLSKFFTHPVPVHFDIACVFRTPARAGPRAQPAGAQILLPSSINFIYVGFDPISDGCGFGKWEIRRMQMILGVGANGNAPNAALRNR
jgi:hypothetical protein